MATYITFGSYTAKGMANIKESPGRLDAARAQLAGIGVTVKDFYLTMGEHDFVTIVEAPDNKTAAKALLALGSQGNVSTTTYAAVTEDEYKALITEMP